MSDSDIPKAWQILNQTLDEKRQFAQNMGGQEKLTKRASQGLPNAREIVDQITDADSFQEIGQLVGSLSYHGEKLSPADALVGGLALINSSKVIIAVEDFTVQGGSIGHGTNAKRVRLATMALEQNLPFIMILDGAGARMSNAMTRHPYGPNDLQIISQLIGKVPTIALVVGSSAGHGAVGAVMMDLVIMLDNSSLFTAGPPLVQAAIGEVISKEDLGGAKLHSQTSGVANLIATDLSQAQGQINEYLSYLSHLTTPPKSLNNENENKIEGMDNPNDLYQIIPANWQQPYDMKKVIKNLVDDDWLELQTEYGKSMLTGLARINGQTVAIIANQPNILAGSIDASAAVKATDFINKLSPFGIPFLFLADTPGVMSGSQAEKQGTLKAAAKMYQAVQTMPSKKLHVTLRKAFGFASCVMAMNPFDHQVISLGLPGLSLGGIPASGGTEAAGMDAEEARMIQEAQQSGAWTAGDALAYDEIVKPCELRVRLVSALS